MKTLRIVLSVLLAAGLLLLGQMGREQAESRGEYAEAEEAVFAKLQENEPSAALQTSLYTDPVIRELAPMELAPLQRENADIIGWIVIPDTEISYPILKGRDNEYYLKNTWKNSRSRAGAIFLDYRSASDFSDFNTVIYGHNMRDGTMFGALGNYRDIAYWREHPYIYIAIDSGVFRYDIFAAQKVATDSIAYDMRPESREALIRSALEGTQIDTGISPEAHDALLTLSTCSVSPGSRWIVQAVRNKREFFRRTEE